jgi:hypothetical protein
VGNDPVNNLDPSGKNTVAGAAAGCAMTGPGCPVGAVVGAVVGTVVTVIAVVVVSEAVSDSEGEATTTNGESSESGKENKGQTKPEVGDCPSCGGETSNKPGAIANDHDMKPKEVKEKIHELKGGAKIDGNPDVEVCSECGEVFPQTEDGGLGDSIGNIKEDDY